MQLMRKCLSSLAAVAATGALLASPLVPGARAATLDICQERCAGDAQCRASCGDITVREQAKRKYVLKFPPQEDPPVAKSVSSWRDTVFATGEGGGGSGGGGRR